MKLECPVPDLQDAWEFEEIVIFYNARRESIKKVIEVGSFYGATLFYWLQNSNLESITAIDWPIDESDHRYRDMIESRAKWKTWVPETVQFNDLVGNSHDMNIIRKALSLYPENDVDWLIVDAGHSEEDIHEDWTCYSPLVRKGGWIAFHDSIGYPSVQNAIKYLKRLYPYTEITSPGGWGWCIFQKI